jgi:hypothetical protein
MIETDRDRLAPLVSRRGFLEQSFKVAGVSSFPLLENTVEAAALQTPSKQ